MERCYEELRRELEVMREELRSRLKKERLRSYGMEMGAFGDENRKMMTVLHDMQDDLKDVERTLLKMEMGVYGVCERTGKQLSIEQLRMIPTARTIDEFSYERFLV